MYKGDALPATGKPSTGDNAIGNLRNYGTAGAGVDEKVGGRTKGWSAEGEGKGRAR